jgi:hypothetical protein
LPKVYCFFNKEDGKISSGEFGQITGYFQGRKAQFAPE